MEIIDYDIIRSDAYLQLKMQKWKIQGMFHVDQTFPPIIQPIKILGSLLEMLVILLYINFIRKVE